MKCCYVTIADFERYANISLYLLGSIKADFDDFLSCRDVYTFQSFKADIVIFLKS